MRTDIPPEPGIGNPDTDTTCPVYSPGGWHCCLPIGHKLNHVATTQGYGSLYQWEQEPSEDERCGRAWTHMVDPPSLKCSLLRGHSGAHHYVNGNEYP